MIDFSFIEDDSSKVEYIQSIGELIVNGEITPEKLNECLANFFPITRYILTLYESVSLEDDNLKLEYNCWYAEKSKESETRLSVGLPPSKTISDSKIQNDVIVNNKSEYINWQQKLIISEKRKSFYYRIMDSWKANSQQIVQLSQNMRTELLTLRVEDRANKDMQKERLIRHVPTENEDEYYDDESEVGAEPIEISTVKKIKKVIK